MITETTYNDNGNPMDWAYLRIKRQVQFLKNNEGNPQQTSGREGDDDLCNCCDPDRNFIQLALADLSDTDPLKNDYLSLLFEVPTTSTTMTYRLQKFVGGAWVNQVVLDSSYGTTYAAGVFTDYPLFAGYKMLWRNVLSSFGEGNYRVRTTIVSIGGTQNLYSVIYCLKAYSVYAADRTVRFEWTNNGIITHSDDDPVIVDYGNINWQDMVRLKGEFRYEKDEQEVIENSFYDGDFLEVERVRDKTNYKYKFFSGYYPDWIHSLLKNVAFKSNNILVTNYNRLAKHAYERKAILKESNGYSPKMDNVYKKWYNVEVDFRDKYDDLGFRANCQPSGVNCEPVTIVDEDGNLIVTVPSGGTYVDNLNSTGCSGNINVYINGSLNQTVATADYSTETINIYP